MSENCYEHQNCQCLYEVLIISNGSLRFAYIIGQKKMRQKFRKLHGINGLFTFLNTFDFTTVLDLQKTCEFVQKIPITLHNQFSLFLTPYIRMAHLLQLMSQYCYVVTNLYFTQISLVFTTCPFYDPGSYPGYHTFCRQVSESPFDCDSFSDFPCF